MQQCPNPAGALGCRGSVFAVLAVGAVWLAGSPALGMPAGAAGPDELQRYFRFLGRLHPLMVHFPVALLLTGALLEVAGLLMKRPKPLIGAMTCVVIGALAAALAAWFGWLNAGHEPQSRSMADTLFWHRWLGIGVAAVAACSIVAMLVAHRAKSAAPTRWYRLFLVATAGLVIAAGHFGGTLVHGEGYLLEVLRPDSSQSAAVADSQSRVPPSGATQAPAQPASSDIDEPAVAAPGGVALVDFRSQILPILETRCVGCHGPVKKKAGLRLDSGQAIFKGEPEDWVVTPGDPAASELYRRISLPSGDPDLMPAEDPPLSPEQIALFKSWIEEGAAVASAGPADIVSITPQPASPAAASGGGAEPAATTGSNQATVPGASAPSPAPPAPAQAATPASGTPPVYSVEIRLTPEQLESQRLVLQRLRDRGAIAQRIAQNTDAVEVNAGLLGEKFTDADLPLLDGLEASLLWLDLSRTAVTDEGVARLSRFTRLRKLHLQRTRVGDAALVQLVPLQELVYLNLHRTGVTDAGLASLKALPALRRLYVWESPVTAAGINDLRAALPALDVVGAPPPSPPPAEPAPAAAPETPK